MTDRSRLTQALKQLGFTVTISGEDIRANNGNDFLTFTKTGPAYSVSGDLRELGSISKKYAEISVREWAKRRGMSVVDNDGTNYDTCKSEDQMSSTLKITLNEDGTVKINASKMKGSEAEILKELNELARELGGELEVEKHAPGVHHHGDGKLHSHE